eukprot:14462289-Ditylum_brightwellii.AAC.1
MRNHLLYCPSALPKTWQTEMLQDLDKTLQVIHTKPSLARTFKQILCQVVGLQHEWLNNNIWTSQAKVGVHANFDGRMSMEWAQEQDEYLVNVKL